MKYVVYIIVLMVLAGCAITGNVINQQNLVCAVMPLTGQHALFGQEFSRGIELAVGNIILENDNYERVATALAMRKLIHTEGCPAVIVPFSETAAVIEGIAHETETPILVVLDDTEHVQESPYLHSVGYSVEQSGKRMAAYAISKGATTAVLVYDQVEYTQLLAASFTEGFENNHGEVMRMYALTPGEDYRTIVTKIIAMNPNVVHFGIVLGDQGSFVRRLREQGYEGQILTADPFQDDSIAAAGGTAEGVCKTDVPVLQDDALLNAYVERYDEEPVIPSFVILGKEAGSRYMHALQLMEEKEITLDEAFAQLSGEQKVQSIYCVQNGILELVVQ